MRKKGSKNSVSLPSGYGLGIPAVNFYLAILNKAKQDEAQMWIDFKGTPLYERGLLGVPDSLEVAWWVSRYIG